MAALRAVTDSAGAFHFPATQVRHRFVVLLPFDRALPSYYLCAGVADTLRPAYRGWGPTRGASRRDSVSCLERRGADGSRVWCSASGV
jgi:hypothetical protein